MTHKFPLYLFFDDEIYFVPIGSKKRFDNSIDICRKHNKETNDEHDECLYKRMMHNAQIPCTIDQQSWYANDNQCVDEESYIEQIGNHYEFESESNIGYTERHTSFHSIQKFEVFKGNNYS